MSSKYVPLPPFSLETDDKRRHVMQLTLSPMKKQFTTVLETPTQRT
jgi:hypothetical protein